VQSFSVRHALADSNQRIWIREKTPEFSSTVLSTLSPYLILQNIQGKSALQHVFHAYAKCSAVTFLIAQQARQYAAFKRVNETARIVSVTAENKTSEK